MGNKSESGSENYSFVVLSGNAAHGTDPALHQSAGLGVRVERECVCVLLYAGEEEDLKVVQRHSFDRCRFRCTRDHEVLVTVDGAEKASKRLLGVLVCDLAHELFNFWTHYTEVDWDSQFRRA